MSPVRAIRFCRFFLPSRLRLHDGFARASPEALGNSCGDMPRAQAVLCHDWCTTTGAVVANSVPAAAFMISLVTDGLLSPEVVRLQSARAAQNAETRVAPFEKSPDCSKRSKGS